MKLSDVVLRSLCTVALVGSLGALSATPARADATKVEVVAPKKAATSQIMLGNGTFGPAGTGEFGISNITISNPNLVAQQVFFGQAILLGGSCGNAGYDIGVNGVPYLSVWVQPQSTLVIPFPTPFIIQASGGVACMGAFANGVNNVQLSVTGFF